jgi:Protein of unknown function (DUF3991)/Toprim-like
MTFEERRQLAPRLRLIPLERVLPLCGAQPDPHDRRKWRTPAGTLSLTGAKFMNWTQGTGGGGAIDLVIHLHRLDFQGAVDWLAGHFPEALSTLRNTATEDGPPQPPSPRPASELRLPLPASGQLARVRDYLIAQRRLPANLVDPLIDSGSLYADARANAVFLLRNQQHLPVGAELRGTTAQPWRGLAPGSRKDLGCFAIPADPRPTALSADRQVVLCESAIDAISCWALYPAYRCLSTAGARPDPRWLRPLLDQDCQLYCGFDADPTGDTMAEAMIALHPSILRLRPPQHDWNDVLQARA